VVGRERVNGSGESSIDSMAPTASSRLRIAVSPARMMSSLLPVRASAKLVASANGTLASMLKRTWGSVSDVYMVSPG
jgi:hypothetical protein